MTLQVQPITPEIKAQIENILDRALKDIEFREELINNPQKALSTSGLSDEHVSLVSTLRRVALEEWGIDVRRFRTFLLDNGFKVLLRVEAA